MGPHWLDLARYSDTKGYVFDREERFFVHAHAYRDWVIRAFNEDLPYDEFLLRQIAADQLPPRPGEVKDGVDQDLAAMGFLTGGRRFLGVTHDIIDDRIDVMMRTMQGLTIGCARCHDHKFDPIPTARLLLALRRLRRVRGSGRWCSTHLRLGRRSTSRTRPS